MSRKKAKTGGHSRSAMELYMDCQDEELSPWQIKAYEHARHLFRESQKIIKSANNGIIETTVPIAQASPAPAARSMLPPPPQPQRPPSTRRSRGRTSSPEVIVLDDDDPPAPATTAAAPSRGRKQVAAPPPTPPQPVPPRPPVAMMNLTPVRPVMMQQQMMVQDPSGGFRPILPQMPKGLVPIHLQNGLDSVFQIPQGAGQGAQFQPVPGTHGMGVKRVTGTVDTSNEPDKKKVKRKQQLENRKVDENASWVPLDEYYYGKKEGDPSYREEKKQFRFKCWYCHRMLYNNLKLMAHIQGHIDSEKQQNLDLMDLTQCKFCYRQFDTPFEMQCHIEKVHQNKTNVLVCRICERDCESQVSLRSHMTSVHQACEMPYVCQLCNFRSSIYNDVVDHFKKRHDSSKNVMCLYCLRVFKMTLTKDGVGKTAAFYQHIQKHQVKNAGKKCSLCSLSFLNKGDLVMHQQNHHRPNHRGIDSGMQSVCIPVNKEDQVMIRLPDKTKSLNAPSFSKVRDYKGLMMPKATDFLACYECNSLMSQPGHYRNYVECSLCRYATVCSIAFSQHMLGYHKGGYRPELLRLPKERPLVTNLFCWCGFSSSLGNTMANHLVSCSKRTCYSTKPVLKYIEYDAEREDFNPFDPTHDDNDGEMSEKEELPKKEMSIFDALGLVKRNGSSNSSPRKRDADMTPEDIALDVMNQIVDSIAGNKHSPKRNPTAGTSPSPGSDRPQLSKPRRYLEMPQKKKPSVRSIFLGATDKEETVDDKGEQAETEKREENGLEGSDSREADTEVSADSKSAVDTPQDDTDLVSCLSVENSLDGPHQSVESSEQVEAESKTSTEEDSNMSQNDGSESMQGSSTGDSHNSADTSLAVENKPYDDSGLVRQPVTDKDQSSHSPVEDGNQLQEEEAMETDEPETKQLEDNSTPLVGNETTEEMEHDEQHSEAADAAAVNNSPVPMDSSKQVQQEPTEGLPSEHSDEDAGDNGEGPKDKQQESNLESTEQNENESGENQDEEVTNSKDETDLIPLGNNNSSDLEYNEKENGSESSKNCDDAGKDGSETISEINKDTMETSQQDELLKDDKPEEGEPNVGDLGDSGDTENLGDSGETEKQPTDVAGSECDDVAIERLVESQTSEIPDRMKAPLSGDQQKEAGEKEQEISRHSTAAEHSRSEDRREKERHDGSHSREHDRGDHHSHRDDCSRDRWQHGSRDSYGDKRYDNRDHRQDDRHRSQDRYHSGGYQGNYNQGGHGHHNDRYRNDDRYNDRHGNRNYNQGHQQGQGHRNYQRNDRGHQHGGYNRNNNRNYRGGYQGGNRGYY